MIRHLLPSVLFCSVCSCATEPLWQLGTADASSKEFRIQYEPWEYGRTPALPKAPGFDAESNTFRCRVTTRGITGNPAMVSGISSENFKMWMHPDEVVTALTLEWSEDGPGNRRIVFHTDRFRNIGDGADALELLLPDGSRELFSVPDSPKETKKDLALTAKFSVRQGTNHLTLRALCPNKHFRLSFDRIALWKTTAPASRPQPNAELFFSNKDFIYDPGEKASVRFKIWNMNGPGELAYTISDAFGKTVFRDTAAVADGNAILSLPASQRGWYGISYTLPGGRKGTASYAVLEPVSREFIEDSRFGCHAVKGFAYLNVFWKKDQEQRLHRAWRAGAKWVRLHGVKWANLQPRREIPPDWSGLDGRLELLERYRMGVLLQMGMTPKWASPSKSERLVPPIGVKAYQAYPPETGAWKQFISALAAHCRGRVRWYEIWNEPNYQSCFWLSGSPEDYAVLIRSAYEAAKQADPDCRIVAGGLVDAHGFLAETLKANNGKAWFDAMGFHYVIRSRSYDRWRQVLRDYPDMPLFNTEESWWNSSDPLEFAAKLVRGHVIEAANGVAKTFAFGFFEKRPYSEVRYGSVNGDGSPLPAYAAYRTMTHRLEHARYAGALTPASSPLKLHLFLRGKTPIVVGWNEGRSPVEAELFPGTDCVVAVDLMDRGENVPAPGGRLRRAFTALPQFVEGGDPEWLAVQASFFRGLPGLLTGRAGTSVSRGFPPELPPGLTLKLLPPPGWNGSLENPDGKYSRFTLGIPQNAAPGTYTAHFELAENGKKAVLPLRIRVDGADVSGNLLRNGDFRQGGENVPAYWFKGKKGVMTRLRGGGIGGSDAWRAENTGNGGVYWGASGRIKVSPGEEYLLTATAKGENGSFGVVCTISDGKGKRLQPSRPGINMLNTRTGSEWNRYFDTIRITHPEAAWLNIALLVNHAAPGGVTFDHIALYAITDRYPAAKHLWRGSGKTAKKKVTVDGMLSEWDGVPAMSVNRREQVVLPGNRGAWNGAADLSATCRVMRDAENLYLAFEVKDDAESPRFPLDKAWSGDSIQIAFDPLMEGQDWSDLVLAHTPEGRPVVWRYHKFWTPELLTGITAVGELKSAKLAIRPVPGGRIYEAAIPLRELYPLTAGTRECGFSFLVNDNDGRERKYIEWSSGIGAKKNPKLFGLLTLED